MFLITLLVGPSEAGFQIQSSILFKASTVFKEDDPAADIGENSDDDSEGGRNRFEYIRKPQGKEVILRFPGDNVDAVDRMVQFLNTGKYQLTPYDSCNHSNIRYKELVELAVQADKFGIPTLYNSVIDQLFDDMRPENGIRKFPPPFHLMIYIYENTPDRSSFRKLMLSWFVYHLHGSFYVSDTFRLALREHADIAADLALSLGQRCTAMGHSPWLGDRTSYYENYDAKKRGDAGKK